MNPVSPAWLTARPIAHRGLHARDRGLIENSASAALAAVAGGYAIECDVQSSRDGEAMVFHDFTLERLTGAGGRVDARTASELARIFLSGSSDRIMELPDFLRLIGPGTTLVCEIKSRFDGDMALAEAAARHAAAWPGPLALKSFDPRVVAHLRANRARLDLARTPLGIVAQANYDDPRGEWAALPPADKQALAQFLHFGETRPDFLSWSVRDLPRATPFLCRTALGLPVMAWTVRTPEQAATARLWADQAIFEGAAPP